MRVVVVSGIWPPDVGGPASHAPALASAQPGTFDPLAIEVALTRRFAELARAQTRDLAVRTYLAQLVDAENAITALLVAARGKTLEPAQLFVAGGERLGAAAFEVAARSAPERARELLAAAFAGTPLEQSIADRDPLRLRARAALL